MIEELSIEKLKEYGFPNEIVERFQKRGDYEDFFDRGYKNMFFASNKELRIYSGIDAARKFHLRNGKGIMTFPEYDLDLVPEYYSLKLSIFIAEKKNLANNIFDEPRCRQNFHEKEKIWTNNEIDDLENGRYFQVPGNLKVARQRTENLEKLQIYLSWLNRSANLEASDTFLRKDINKPLKIKTFYDTFEEATVDVNRLNKMYQVLLDKKVIDNHYNLIKSATLLYGLIKRFRNEGYFKKITIKALHPLINAAFKTQTTYQALNQAPVYSGLL